MGVYNRPLIIQEIFVNVGSVVPLSNTYNIHMVIAVSTANHIIFLYVTNSTFSYIRQ